MRLPLLLLTFFSTVYLSAQVWHVQEKANMPMPISNNAVIEGTQGGTPYVYSFGGIDSTKTAGGITLKSFRYNTGTNTWDTIANIPDTLGKIAMGASNVKNKIYIIGGYHVRSNHSEVSSDKVHIFDPQTNTFLADGAPIPVPIDDHVQAVYRDSLIFVISGWSNTGNVPNVQIYDPANDQWSVGTAVPSNGTYMHFGASGAILNDRIYYFGGARMGFNFPITNVLRIGDIDPADPTNITWSDTVINSSRVGYRMAATVAFGRVHWIGGSGQTYNYDGLAYSNGKGVEPLNRSLTLINQPRFFFSDSSKTTAFPMDLRGIATETVDVRYIAGGMEAGQKVSNKLLKLTHFNTFGLEDEAASLNITIYPNPIDDELSIQCEEKIISLELYSIGGKQLKKFDINQKHAKIDVTQCTAGLYFLKLSLKNQEIIKKITIK